MMCEAGEVREEIKRILPPSERDREIFHRVMGKHEGQAAVAREFGLSQPRVSQIVEQVLAWLAEATPAETGDFPPEKRLRLGSYLVRMRLECLLDATMQSWRASQGDLTTTKSRDEGGTERVTKPSFGDVKYLTAFRHVALALARLDGVPTAPKIERQEAAAPQPVAQPAAEPAAAPVPAAEPVASDLYPEAVAEAPIEPAAPEPVAENPAAAMTCDVVTRPKTELPEPQNARQRAYKQAWQKREKRRERAAQRRLATFASTAG